MMTKNFPLKLTLIFLVIFFAFLGPLSAVNKTNPKKRKKTPLSYKGIRHRPDELLEKLLEDKDVKPIYENCKTKKIKDMADCIYQELKATPALLKQVTDKYLPKSKDSGPQRQTPGERGLDILTLHDKPFKFYPDSPAVKKLEEYLDKKLEEHLYGEITNKAKAGGKKIKIIDHLAFYQIYRKHIGKTIIRSLGAYCLNADSAKNHLIPKGPKDQRKVRTENLKGLADFIPVTNLDGSTTEAPVSYQRWSGCIVSIPKICGKIDPYDSGMYDDDADFKYSRRRACIVTDYIKALRAELIAALYTENKFKELKTDGGFDYVENVEMANVDEKKKEKVTTMTSAEFVNKTGYREEIEKAKMEFVEKCKNNRDDDICKKYLYSEDERSELDKKVTGLALHSKLIKDKLEESLSTEDGIKAYLEREGRDKDQIDEILKQKSIDEIKTIITKQFESQRKGIVEELRKQLESRSEPPKDPVKAGISTLDPMQVIEEEFSSKIKQHQEQIYYSNFISGFLSVMDEEGTFIGRNISSLKAELQENIYDSEMQDTAKIGEYNKAEMEKLRKTIMEKVDVAQQQDEGVKGLGIKELNQAILNYYKD